MRQGIGASGMRGIRREFAQGVGGPVAILAANSGVQASQPRLACRGDTGLRVVLGRGLGKDAGLIPGMRQRLAHQFFRSSVALALGGIDQASTDVQEGVDCCQGIALILLAPDLRMAMA